MAHPSFAPRAVRWAAADAPATPARADEVRAAVVAVVPDALLARPYDRVSYTFIARLARVTAADVRRCYATKAELVLAALRTPLAPSAGRTPLELSGAEIVRRYLKFWETDDNALILRSVAQRVCGLGR
ncbi:MAG: hypothetical protein ACXVP1_07775 [Thermoleophilia bacterium]